MAYRTRVRLVYALLVVSIVILPLDYLPARFEAHETHRAVLLLTLVSLALPLAGLPRLQRATAPLSVAVVIWCGALVISTLFALSPTRALWGDVYRRMGLLTQAALVGGALLGARLKLTRDGCWFAWVGAAVAVLIVLQALGWLPTAFQGRPDGTLGAPVYAGGWLALVSLWAGGWAVDTHRIRRRRLERYLMGGGLVVMAVALLLTGARGAALALLAGLLTAGCLWAALKRARWLALVIVGLAVMSGGGLLALSQINWATSPLAQLPLLARLNPGVMDSPRISRELTWANALRISREWPGMVDVWGEADRYRTLRPWLGYGLETFEFVHRPLVSAALLAHEGGRPIDRAHNDWLDALVTLGWFGLAARLLLWGAAWWVGLGRLGLRRMPVFILAAVGALIGIGVAGASPYLPVIVTAGGLVGIWAGVLINSLFVTPPSQWSTQHTALLTALAILTAHLVDLQFSFTTVAAGWPAWLAVGLLLRARTQPAQMD